MNDNKEFESRLAQGTTLRQNTYRIERSLASGGFGNTYLATHIRLKKKYAIKEFFMRDINTRGDDSTTVSISNATQVRVFEEQKEKFLKEAERLAELSNWNIVGVTDVFDENGTAYYVMDYIDGLSLRDMVQQDGHVPEATIWPYFGQVLDALEVVHDKNIFHLDLKPANIMVDRDGRRVHVIDFGASKQQKKDGGATSRSAVCYTPGYAPIEQKEQETEKFGPWTDLYALGATLYNIATGLTPPSTNNILDYGEDAFEWPDNISPKLKSLIVWMMQGSRFARPQSVADVRYFIEHGEKPPKQKPKLKPEAGKVVDVNIGDEGTILTPPPGLKLKPEPKLKFEPKPEPKPESKPELKPELKPEPKLEPKSEPKQELEPELEQEFGSERKLGLSPKTKRWTAIGAGVAAVAVGGWLLFSPTADSPPNAEETTDVKTLVKTIVPDSANAAPYSAPIMGDYLYTGPLDSDSLPHGRGHADILKGASKDSRAWVSYDGFFLHGTFDGDSAVLKLNNGDIFAGTFKDNHFHEGRYTQKNGEYYEGTFDANGNLKDGEWHYKNGKVKNHVGNGYIELVVGRDIPPPAPITIPEILEFVD